MCFIVANFYNYTHKEKEKSHKTEMFCLKTNKFQKIKSKIKTKPNNKQTNKQTKCQISEFNNI